nr:hypothetical protein Iba_chr10eCG11420 [Ipomoea batatas]
MAERRWAYRRAVPLPLLLEKETTPRAGEGEPTVANCCYAGGGRSSQGDLTGDSPLPAVETAVEGPLSAHSLSEEGGDVGRKGDWPEVSVVVRWPFTQYAGVAPVHALDSLYKRYQLPTTFVDVISRRNRGRKEEGAGKLPTPSKARRHIAGNREEQSPSTTIDQPRSCIVP